VGTANDHSTPDNDADASVLIKNIKEQPLGIILGEQGKVYKISSGNFEIDQEATRKQMESLERSMS
jgi:hypothetical protein